MLKRKFRKLVNNPKLFFSDMAIKHSDKISYLKPKKMEGHYQYTVVSAVYNVGRYLDDYFNSLVKQRLDFKKHITLILVDDGSTDNSAEIIKRWQKKYPNNIQYIYKENGGQASARNLGLKSVKTKWVTFIDPDDTLSRDYFYEVDGFINKNNQYSFKMIACNLIFFFEDKNTLSDTHPLKFRFEGNPIHSCKDLNKSFHLSASSAFFITHDIINENIIFDDRIKPNFEDGHFIAQYLLRQTDGKVVFLKNPKYIYRKRSDGSSKLDTSWGKIGRYSDVFKFGYLDVLKKSLQIREYVPNYIQRAILYDMMWYLKKIVNHPETVSFMNEDEKNNFISYIKEVFTYIDVKTILDFELAGCWFYHKVGMLEYLKGDSPKNQIVYIEKYDNIKGQVLIKYFTSKVQCEEIYLSGEERIPEHDKTTIHSFVNEVFLLERRMWVNVRGAETLKIRISGIPARISLQGSQSTSVSIKSIARSFDKKLEFQQVIPKYYKDCWLLMDRDIQADDNAEHLYRYISSNYPDETIFFVLRKESHDWKRLHSDGFKLIAFGSEEHETALRGCNKLISSHADHYITDYFGPSTLDGKHFIFLQHGVIKEDLSGWLNSKNQIDIFVTSTKPEYESIAGSSNNYKFTSKEVVLTGLPRHDKLISGASETEKLIIIMPTWRKNIVGKAIGLTTSRNFNYDFNKTKFSQSWQELLCSNEFINLAKENGYKVVFFPHANLVPYVDSLNLPDFIEVKTHEHTSIQELFKRAALMITDYSSVAFEMAAQGKPVLYYQFDEEEVFSGAHTYARGYFDYRRDGFGPVATTSQDCISAFGDMLRNNGFPNNDYIERINNTFPFRDGNNCERVYQAIKELDIESTDTNDVNSNLFSSAERASISGHWVVAERRWKQYIAINSDDSRGVCRLAEAIKHQGRYTEAETVLNENLDNTDELYIHKAGIYSSMERWGSALEMLNQVSHFSLERQLLIIECLANLHLIAQTERAVAELKSHQLCESKRLMLDIWLSYSRKDWKKIISLLTSSIGSFSTESHRIFKPYLILAKAYRLTSQWSKAGNALSIFESIFSDDPKCREEIAFLSHATSNWDKTVYQINRAYPNKEDIPEATAVILLDAMKHQIKNIAKSQVYSSSNAINIIKVQMLRESGKLNESKMLFDSLFKLKDNKSWDDSIHTEAARLEMAQYNWLSAINYWERCSEDNDIAKIARLRCLSEMKRSKAINRVINDSRWFSKLPECQRLFVYSLYHISKCEWNDAIKYLVASIEIYDKDFLIIQKPELILSSCYREIKSYVEAEKALLDYESHTKNDPLCREQIALLAWERCNYSKVIQQVNRAYSSIDDMPDSIVTLLLAAYQKSAKFEDLQNILNTLASSRREIIAEKLESIMKDHSFLSAA